MNLVKIIHSLTFFSLLFLSFFILAVLGIFILFVCFLSTTTTKVYEKKETFTHKEIRYNIPENSFSVGFVSIYDELRDGRYIFHESEDTQVLISRFGGSEEDYHCIGSCYCSNDVRRFMSKKSLVPLSRGLTTLLSSASIIIASKFAKETFHEKCVNEYYPDQCAIESVVSEVDKCTKLDPDDSISKSSSELKKKGEKTKFHCIGNCIYNNRYIDYLVKDTHPNWKSYNDEVLQRIEEDIGEMVKGVQEICKSYELDIDIHAFSKEEAMKIFQEDKLGPFCYKNGFEELKKACTEVTERFVTEIEKKGAFESKGGSKYVPGDDWEDIINYQEKGKEGMDELWERQYSESRWDEKSFCAEANPPDFVNSNIVCLTFENWDELLSLVKDNPDYLHSGDLPK